MNFTKQIEEKIGANRRFPVVQIKTIKKYSAQLNSPNMKKPCKSPQATKSLSSAGFDCQICRKRFKLETQLILHTGIDHPEGDTPFPCSVCPDSFKTSDDLKEHLGSKHSDQFLIVRLKAGYTYAYALKYECSHCQKKFLSVSQLITHSRHCYLLKTSQALEHKITGPTSSNLRQLREKLEKNKRKVLESKLSEKKRVNCDHCDFSTKSQKILRNHQQKRHENRLEQVPEIKITESQSSNIRQLREKPENNSQLIEVPESTLSTKKRLKCDHCDFSTKSLKILGNHQQKRHHNKLHHVPEISKSQSSKPRPTPNPKLFRKKRMHCDRCEFSTKSQKILGNHKQKRHQNRLDEVFESKICAPKSLKVHRFREKVLESKLVEKSRLHTGIAPPKGDTPFPCSVCPDSFKTSNDLKEHLGSKHSDKFLIVRLKAGYTYAYPLKYECSHCSKKFYRVSLLITHSKHCYLRKQSQTPERKITRPTSSNLQRFQEKLEKRKRKVLESKLVEKKRLHCEHCDFSTKSQKILGNHMQKRHHETNQVTESHSPDSSNLRQLQEKPDKNSQHIKKEVQSKLSEKKRRKCKHCDFSTKSEKILGNHMQKRHHHELNLNKLDQMPENPPIPKSYNLRQVQEKPAKNSKSKLVEKKQQKCKHCDFSTKSLKILGNHMQKRHPEVQNRLHENDDNSAQKSPIIILNRIPITATPMRKKPKGERLTRIVLNWGAVQNTPRGPESDKSSTSSIKSSATAPIPRVTPTPRNDQKEPKEESNLDVESSRMCSPPDNNNVISTWIKSVTNDPLAVVPNDCNFSFNYFIPTTVLKMEPE